MTLLHQAAQKAVLTDKQIQDAVFVVLRRWNTDRAWDRYTRESGPYDVTSLRPEVLEIIRAVLAIVPPALQHQEVPREPEPVGTFACSVCGVAEPHHHDIAYINKRRVEEAVLRPRFEQLLHNLMQGGEPFSELRVSGWGNPIFWNKRWPTPSIEMPAAYRDMKAEALWQFFLRAHYAASPSTTRQQEVGSDDEWKQEAATVLARFIHLSAQPVVEEWAQTASAAIRLLNDPAGLAAAPSTPEKAGGEGEAVVAPGEDQR